MKVSLSRFASLALVAACVAALAAAVAAARTSRSAADIKNGGTLTIGLAEEPDALDPTLARTFVGRIVFLSMCEKLYDLDSHLNIVPQLATALPRCRRTSSRTRSRSAPASSSTTERRSTPLP